MALEIKIGGTTYRGTTDYSIKQQGGAVSTTSLGVLLESNPVPLVLQVAQVYLDSTLFFTGLIQTVSTPEYSSTYETKIFSIEVSSLECLMNHRLVTKNFYYYSYTSWTQVVQYIFDNYISEEGITLGAISATAATFDSKYSVKDKKVFDVLNEIANSIGNASWWISADRKFYFKISTDFTSVVAPTHLTKLKLADKIGDIRTVEKMTGASAGITATEINATLLATLAARTGGSGKIEIAESDSDIHSDPKAASEASARLSNYAESEKTITCTCHDLDKSTPYNSWPLSLSINGVAISGDYVVTERTISDHGPDAFSISVTLKNNNYFARYGYSLKRVAVLANDATSSLSDIAADNKLTASEKKDELPKWNAVVAEKDGYDSEADAHSVSRVAYDASLQALGTYLNGGTAWVSGDPLWFAGEHFTETTDIDGDTYDAAWQAYYDARSNLEVAIRNAIQADAEAAQSAADAAAAIANAASRTWTQSSAPTIGSRPNAINGDTWYDSDDGSKYEAIAGVWSLQTTDVPLDPVAYYSMDEVPEIPDDPAGIEWAWNHAVDWTGTNGGTVTVEDNQLHVSVAGYSQGPYWFKSWSIGIKEISITYKATTQFYILIEGSTVGDSLILPASSSFVTLHIFVSRSTVVTNALVLYSGTPSGEIYVKDIQVGTGAYLPGSVLDNSGHGNHGQAFSVTPVAGISGNGLLGDGYIDMPPVLNTNEFSISVWKNITQVIAGDAFMANHDSGNYPIINIPHSTTTRAIFYLNSECYVYSNTLELGMHLFTFCYKRGDTPDQNIIDIYIDGKIQSATKSSTLYPVGLTSPLRFYSRSITDELVIYDRAISAPEVLGLYQSKSLPKVYTRAQYLADSAASDGIITPAEKYNILTLWYQIGKNTSSGSYGTTRARAVALGVSHTALDAAWNALYAYLWTTPGVLIATSWDSNIAASKTTLANLNAAYYSAELAQTNANTTADAQAKIPVYAPKYLGIGILQAASTAAFPGAVVYSNGSITVTGLTVIPNTGDWMTNYDATHLALGIYYWSGSAWTLTASTETKYISSSGYDLLNLRAGGIDIGGVEIITAALINFLATSKQVSTELCSDRITRRMEIDWDNAIMSLRDSEQISDMEVSDGYVKAYKGQGVQRRYAKLSQESLDFVDAPDTTPASSEVLQGRIGRLGVGSAILMDGDFEANVASQWSSASSIGSTLATNVSLVVCSGGTLKAIHTRNSDLAIVERSFNRTTKAWGGESVIGYGGDWALSSKDTSDGQVRLAYTRSPDHHLVERVWSGSSWGAETVINAGETSGGASYLESLDGIIRISYARTSDGYLVERVWSGSSWGAETVINAGASAYPSYCTRVNGEIRITYSRHSDGYLVERVWSGTTWGSETIINPAASYGGGVISTIDNGMRIGYRRASDSYLVERVWSGSSWGEETVINAAESQAPSYIQDIDGSIVLAYTSLLDSLLHMRTLTRYAKIGTGIIERGSNSNGSYIKFGDGTLECYGTHASEIYSSVTVVLPYAFSGSYHAFAQQVYSAPIISGAPDRECVYYSANTQFAVYGLYAPDGVNYNAFSWHAIGRWKA